VLLILWRDEAVNVHLQTPSPMQFQIGQVLGFLRDPVISQDFRDRPSRFQCHFNNSLVKHKFIES